MDPNTSEQAVFDPYLPPIFWSEPATEQITSEQAPFIGFPGLFELPATTFPFGTQVEITKVNLLGAIAAPETEYKNRNIKLEVEEHVQAMENEMLTQCHLLNEDLEGRRIRARNYLAALMRMEDRWKMGKYVPADQLFLQAGQYHIIDIGDDEPSMSNWLGLEAVRKSRNNLAEIGVIAAPVDWEWAVGEIWVEINERSDAIRAMLVVLQDKLPKLQLLLVTPDMTPQTAEMISLALFIHGEMMAKFWGRPART